MDTQAKTCPKCSSVMDYRLGVYDCPQCGHTEAKPSEQQQRNTAGPGFRKESWTNAASGQQSAVPALDGRYDPAVSPDSLAQNLPGKSSPPIGIAEWLIYGSLTILVPPLGLVMSLIWMGQKRNGANGCLIGSLAYLALWVYKIMTIVVVVMQGAKAAAGP